MKYVWIVMLIIVEIIWSIFSIKDFTYTAKRYKYYYIWEMLKMLEGYTISFIIVHLCLLFGYSLALFIKGLM